MSKNIVELLGGGTSNTERKQRVEFGVIDSEKSAPGIVGTRSNIRELVVPFNFDRLPSTSEDDIMIDIIPANSFYLDARFYVIEDFVGGAEYEVGLARPDGFVLDPDGLFSTLDLPSANLTAGNWIVGTGSLIGFPLAADAQIIGAENGAFTSGKGAIIVRYIEPLNP